MPGPASKRWKACTKAGPSGLALVLCVLVQALSARAAEFSISPISLQFAPGSRSAVVAISNSDQRPIRFQLSLVEWTQNAQGEDVYTPSDDLIFFPRQLTVAAGARGIARVGPKSQPPGLEKTYRLRIEELAEPLTALTGSALAMTITFAIPVFSGAQEAQSQLLLEPLRLQGGTVLATVRNAGKAHLRIESLELTGADGYAQQLAGWYLLSGASREYSLVIPSDVCRTHKQLHLSVKVGEQLFGSDLDLDPGQCGT